MGKEENNGNWQKFSHQNLLHELRNDINKPRNPVEVKLVRVVLAFPVTVNNQGVVTNARQSPLYFVSSDVEALFAAFYAKIESCFFVHA